MKSDHKELFQETRKLLLAFDGFMETKKDRIMTYSNDRGGICHMRTMNHGIDIGFLKGTGMEDKFGLPTGNGKVMRVLPVKSIDEECIKYYITQTVKINAAQ